MPLYFFDTSALVKRYHIEAGSEKVNEIFANPKGIYVISSLAISEFTSALTRKVHTGVLSDDDLRACLSEFSKDMISFFWIIDLERQHINNSISLIIKDNLRTLDSLHLSVFLNLSPMSPIMVTSDKALHNAVLKEGFQSVNPSS